MATARTMIARSLRKLGVLDPSETMDATTAGIGLEELNSMLGTLGLSKLLVYSITRNVFPLVIGQQTYTLGTSGANFTMPRMQKIDMLSVIPSSDATQEIPISIITDAEWREISIKSITCSWPTECLVTNGYPLWTLDVWPVPSELSSIVVYGWEPLQRFTSIDTALAMPEGYEDLITYNLAVRLAPEFRAVVPAEVAFALNEARHLVKTANFIPVITDLDPAWGGCGSDNAEKTNGYLVD